MGILEKSYEVRYLTHMIVFPDGDALVEQKPFIHELDFELNNWQYLPPFNGPDVNFSDCARSLKQKGEYKFITKTPRYGDLTHVIQIEDKERQTGWFGTPKEK